MLEKLKGVQPGSRLVKQQRRGPVWAGPESQAPNGGVTFSLLSRFLVCRERFRVLVVEGLKPIDTFNHLLEFGQMWHACEEAHAAGGLWWTKLASYCRDLRRRYPLQQDQIAHWGAVANTLFPHYIDHWSKHPDVTERQPLFQEKVFDVLYSLPSGRAVRLRGKWDAVDLIGGSGEEGVYLQENKTKSQIDGRKIARQLRSDLQSMLYLITFDEWSKHRHEYVLHDRDTEVTETAAALGFPLYGIRYNVVRRSTHKSCESMLKKVAEDRAAGRIGEWFSRWKVDISPEDVAKFRRECLDPILENLCFWWDVVTYTGDKPRSHEAELFRRYGVPPLHWRHPFGVYNVLDEGGSTDLDNYLETGSEVGLQRVEDLFPELTTEGKDGASGANQ